MANTPHELNEEFPEFANQIHALKTQDAHFLRLFDEYHEVNRAVHRSETDIEPTTDEHMIELRKQRASLKDEIYKMLTAK